MGSLYDRVSILNTLRDFTYSNLETSIPHSSSYLDHTNDFGYKNSDRTYNPQWKAKTYKPTFIDLAEWNSFASKDPTPSKFDQFFPVTFKPSHCRFRPKCEGIKLIPGQDKLHVDSLVREFFENLFEAGHLVKRRSNRTWLLHSNSLSYPWENVSHVSSEGTIIKTTSASSTGITMPTFLVNNNQHDTARCRGVSNGSQFSNHKGRHMVMNKHFPKYASPNLKELQQLIPENFRWLGLDLSNAFYHIPINPEAWKWLTVSDGTNLYAYRKLPMGLGLSPFIMQMFMNKIKRILEATYGIYVICYLDDMIIGHLNKKYLQSVASNLINSLQKFGLLINFDKSSIVPTDNIEFMGYRISSHGIFPKPALVEKLLKNLPHSTSRSSCPHLLAQIFGLINFFMPFLVGYNFHDRQHSIIPSSLTAQELPIGLKREEDPKLSNIIFVDASMKYIGLSFPILTRDHNRAFEHYTIPILPEHQHLPIHLHEMAAAIIALLICPDAPIATDSTFVLFKKYNTITPSACTWLLQQSHLVRVASKDNPADKPSRHPLFGIINTHPITLDKISAPPSKRRHINGWIKQAKACIHQIQLQWSVRFNCSENTSISTIYSSQSCRDLCLTTNGNNSSNALNIKQSPLSKTQTQTMLLEPEELFATTTSSTSVVHNQKKHTHELYKYIKICEEQKDNPNLFTNTGLNYKVPYAMLLNPWNRIKGSYAQSSHNVIRSELNRFVTNAEVFYAKDHRIIKDILTCPLSASYMKYMPARQFKILRNWQLYSCMPRVCFNAQTNFLSALRGTTYTQTWRALQQRLNLTSRQHEHISEDIAKIFTISLLCARPIITLSEGSMSYTTLHESISTNTHSHIDRKVLRLIPLRYSEVPTSSLVTVRIINDLTCQSNNFPPLKKPEHKLNRMLQNLFPGLQTMIITQMLRRNSKIYHLQKLNKWLSQNALDD